jgi:adenylyltransferase/sulfurtransferase
MELTDTQFERYARHLILEEVGDEGQQTLLASKVLCVGAGGLGSPILMYLAAAGIGTIGIVDDDEVDLSNLQRQIVHATASVGLPKAISAAETLARINPTITVVPYQTRLMPENVEALFAEYDLIVDGTDNFTTRYLINDAAYFSGKAVVSGALLRFEGQLTTFRGGVAGHKGEPCYRCLFRNPPPPNTVPRCEEAGILGAIAGVIGTMQATEVLKELMGLGESMSGNLLVFDGMGMTFQKIRYKRSANCPLCGDAPTITAVGALGPV